MNSNALLIQITIITAITSVLLTLTVQEYINRTHQPEPHHHVKAKHFITDYKLAEITYCKTEGKLITFNGKHVPIVAPVIIYPEGE